MVVVVVVVVVVAIVVVEVVEVLEVVLQLYHSCTTVILQQLYYSYTTAVALVLIVVEAQVEFVIRLLGAKRTCFLHEA